jgi:hypothetical protein
VVGYCLYDHKQLPSVPIRWEMSWSHLVFVFWIRKGIGLFVIWPREQTGAFIRDGFIQRLLGLTIGGILYIIWFLLDPRRGHQLTRTDLRRQPTLYTLWPAILGAGLLRAWPPWWFRSPSYVMNVIIRRLYGLQITPSSPPTPSCPRSDRSSDYGASPLPIIDPIGKLHLGSLQCRHCGHHRIVRADLLCPSHFSRRPVGDMVAGP